MTEPVAILTDTTLCTGCEKCVAACKEENELGPDRPWREQRAVDDLSATRFCTIVQRPGNRFIRQQCRHCLDPACVSACLVGAMVKTPEGPVVYDRDRCIGCRYCLTACPYGVPRYEWQQAAPSVRKCDLCSERIRAGEIPACVEACPEEATIFGSRSELLEEAHRRLDAYPEKYINKVFGQYEVGGTSVLYLSDVPLDFLAWQPVLGEQPLPDRTWKALRKVPPTILAVGGVMAGIYWIIGRRMRLAAQTISGVESGDPASSSPAEPTEGNEEDDD